INVFANENMKCNKKINIISNLKYTVNNIPVIDINCIISKLINNFFLFLKLSIKVPKAKFIKDGKKAINPKIAKALAPKL
ncbi:hypothetical protein PVA17_24890, partial [Lysinibacillus sp. CNPSo 3705]|uniref:hypothetical protein n=1 Tax=Lysinibacillus sp. CNPSo 3705 TaxID=3028148 RepID=UPI0023643874